jgi:hypothetical protein
MRYAKTILAIFIIAMLAMSTSNAALKTPSAQEIITGNGNTIKLERTSVKIGSIDYGSAAPGNHEPVTVMVEVISTSYPTGICGLNKSNFKIEVPTRGFGYTAIAIKNVLGISSTAVGSPISCSYGIQIAPGIFQGKQYTWTNSPGTFNLYYFKGANQVAFSTFNLKMYAS